MIAQVSQTLSLLEGDSKEQRKERINSTILLLQGIGPTDEIEGMLAVQMVATHNAIMECLRRAMLPDQTFEGRDQNLKHAAKLLAIYTRQIETLNKHRGKGQQKVTVEYVSVEAGGQAMVGHIETGKNAKPKRRRAKRSVKAIPDNPGQTIDMDVPAKEPARSRKN